MEELGIKEFHLLRGDELIELLNILNDIYIEYRTCLGVSQNISFGVELEYEGIQRKDVNKFLHRQSLDWESKNDGSLIGGGEIASVILYDKEEIWLILEKICKHLTFLGANTSCNAGGHIHVGVNSLGENWEAWEIFLKLYTIYEHVLYRFMYGDKVSHRRNIYKYAVPVADRLKSGLDKARRRYLQDYLSDVFIGIERNHAINFNNVQFNNLDSYDWKSTLEFRFPNATSNHVVLQNNINALLKMIMAARSRVINMDFLDFKLREEYLSFYSYPYVYDEVMLKSALEFVDLVFDNELDKLYFLKQYIKNFQENCGLKGAVKTKRFVKR